MDPTLKDKLLGMLAVEKSLLKQKELTKCLNISEFFDGGDLKDLMVEKGYISRYQAEKLEKILLKQSDPDSGRFRIKFSDLPFGELAVEKGIIDEDQLDEALEEQEDFADLGRKFPIGQILMSLGFMTPDQVTKLLEMQGRACLKCHTCNTYYTVQNYEEDKFYFCKRCKDDLREAIVTSITREELEAKIAIKQDDSPAAAPSGAPGRKHETSGRPAYQPMSADDASAYDDDDDDDDEDSDDDLMVLEL